jgi:CTP-dependent riboflavin kinase
MTSALHNLGSSVAQVADKLGSHSGDYAATAQAEIQVRLRGLKERIEQEAIERKVEVGNFERAQAEGNSLLSRIMSKLDNMS